MKTAVSSASTMSPGMDKANNYFQWIYNLFSHYLTKHTYLEIGSGHGNYAEKLLEDGHKVIISDIDSLAVEKIKEKMKMQSNLDFLVMNGIEKDKVSEFSLDGVILINVLEHIQRDSEIIEKASDVLMPGGVIVIVVPAWPILYSEMDRQAGHYRRYRPEKLRKILSSYFEIEKISEFNRIGALGWAFNKWKKTSLQSESASSQIQIFNKMVPYLEKIDPYLLLPGQSILAIGTKRS